MRVTRKTRRERKRTIVHITDLRREEYPLQLRHPREDLLKSKLLITGMKGRWRP